VLGGYYLSGKEMEMRIEHTIADLKDRIRPRVVAPGHCTGWPAKAAHAHLPRAGTVRASSARLMC
jgi:7,8-dihydropterin-6-yl-methyl-4-(beta-D-ribofuranosyl)aminobenzene 5'-phosphate synthase